MKTIHKWRPTIFFFSLICVLSFLLLAFNYSTTCDTGEPHIIDFEPEQELEVIRTIHKKPVKSVPPPEAMRTETNQADEEVFPDQNDLPPESFPVTPLDSAVDNPPGPAPVPEAVPAPTPDEPINFPDKMPFFGDCYGLEGDARKACSDKSILSFMTEGVKYPRIAREAGIEGVVFIQFVVDKEGNLSDFRVLRDIGGGCGEEALRVVQEMPKWSPGVQNGRPVSVFFRMPVKFALKQ